MSSVQGGFAMTGAFAAGLLPQAPFTYTATAVWRYFLVAHQRYFGEFFLVNQRLTRNPTLSARLSIKSTTYSGFCNLYHIKAHIKQSHLA